MLLNTMLTRGGLIFTSVKKLKPCGSDFPPIYSINSRYSIKVQELTDPFHKTDHNSPAPGISMSNTYLGKGKKDRCVAISAQLLHLLRIFKKRFPSDDFVFFST